ncbi:MAG: hypothetical protein ACXWIN_06535 [Burkholderiaceae bacterium]
MRNNYLADTRTSHQTSYLKRHASIIIGVALSVLVHAFVIWFLIERNPPLTHEKLLGNSDRLSITLLSPTIAAKPQNQASPSEVKESVKKIVQTKKKTPRPVIVPQPKPEPATPPVIAHAEPKVMRPPPADDMSSMLEAARRRRAQAQNRDSDSTEEDETQRRNKAVLANIATSIGHIDGTNQNGRGGVFQMRRKGLNSAEFLFRGWSADLHRNSTQLIEVFKKSEPDIETAVIKKMIEIIRENKHDEFVWESYRLGRDVTLSARPENEDQLERFLMQEFFTDYVPVRQ